MPACPTSHSLALLQRGLKLPDPPGREWHKRRAGDAGASTPLKRPEAGVVGVCGFCVQSKQRGGVLASVRAGGRSHSSFEGAGLAGDRGNPTTVTTERPCLGDVGKRLQPPGGAGGVLAGDGRALP